MANFEAGDGQDYYDLGSYHRSVNSTSDAAQTWFDRGLIWSYAFNHEEAIRCFERAVKHDPNCAMAHWGLAYALGPNYNKPWEFFDESDLKRTLQRAYSATIKGKGHAKPKSVESALIDALQLRYAQDVPPMDFATRNRQYASAMELVYQEYTADLDVATLYAEALMNLTPWQMWDLRSGNPAPGARTMDAKAVIDHALKQKSALSHPGLLHMYIHLMEMSPAPESVLPVADHLRMLVPDAGHLNHMPTHLDILCGDYMRAIVSNSDAIRADEKFLSKEGPVNFYSLYRSHDHHFLIYAAMFAGQSKVALETVQRLETSLPEEALRVESPPLADWLEGFIGIRMHVFIRFGRWQDIINTRLPEDRALYCVTTAMVHYAKGVAFAATGKINEAEEEQSRFQDAVKKVPSSRTLFNNTCVDILSIASAMLDGELEYRRGNFDLAFEHLRRSISLDDSLPYDEPWGWMQPTRHAYGALLLEQGHVEQAAAVYKADLGLDGTLPRALQHPNNVWALHGYHECLVRLGHAEEASVVEVRLKKASENADVPITSSCFCRLSIVEDKKVDEGDCCLSST